MIEEVVNQDKISTLARPVTGTVFEGRVARTHSPGDPLQYAHNTEHPLQTRSLEQLKNIVEQLPGKPITLGHPDDLISRGAIAQIVGKILEARVEGDHAVASFLVTDEEAIEAIKKGIRQLSLGYLAHVNQNHEQESTIVDHTAIVPQARGGQTLELRSDSVDGKIHLDCSESCACGGTCKLNLTGVQYANNVPDIAVTAVENQDEVLDAKARKDISPEHFAVPGRKALPIEDEGHLRAAMARFNQTNFQSTAEKKSAYHRIVARAHELGVDPSGFIASQKGHMDEITEDAALKAKMDDLSKKLTEAQDALQKAELDRDNAKASLQKAQDALSTLTANKDAADKTVSEAIAAAKAELEAAKAKVHADAGEAFENRVNARIEILKTAEKILGTVDNKMADRDLKVAVVKHVDSIEIPADKHDFYVDGMFAGAVQRHSISADSRAAARTVIQDNREEGLQPPLTGEAAEKALQAEMAARASRNWKNKK